MRAIKITLSALVILMVMSCETHYRMVTKFEQNGKVYREVYAHKYMADSSINPFIFPYISSGWLATLFASPVKYNFFGEETEFNIRVWKMSNSIEQYSQEIQCDEEMQSFVAPKESLVKKNRWFYTYYSFNAVFKHLKYEAPVPISNYLKEEEQIFWTRGDKYLNGYETTSYARQIEHKFMNWYYRNVFEISYESIKKRTTGYDLNADKEEIYEIYRNTYTDICLGEESRTTSEQICTVLDSFYKTRYFSQLYKTHKEILDEEFQKSTSVVAHIGNIISYELIIPAKVLQTDAPIIHSDTLIWKVDGMRLLFDDYTLTAEYRVANTWAFVITGLIVVIAIGSVVILVNRNRRFRLG